MMADIFNIQRARISDIISEVSEAILTLEDEFLGFPSYEECLKSAIKYHEIADFPSVVACVDGTHVEFHPPREIDSGFINRHHRKSYNIAVVAGNNFLFLEPTH